jgi:SAM-dependent methyltransferase
MDSEPQNGHHCSAAIERRRKVSTDIPQLDWQDWMHRYDQQQSTYLPDREKRFTVMLDVLETLLPKHFVALDLACGPGSISQRLLSRFPQARSVAVDIDPILLLLGQQVLGDMQGRLRWVEADISEPSWHSRLGEEQVDAVVTTTALHWLHAGSLVELYRQLGVLVRPGGVFLNGDGFGFAPHLPSFNTVTEHGHAQWAAMPTTCAMSSPKCSSLLSGLPVSSTGMGSRSARREVEG